MARFCQLVEWLITPLFAIEVRGRKSLDDAAPVVLAANHRSLADLWVGLVVFGRLGIYPGILFNRKFLPGPLSAFARGAGVILVDKGGATAAGIDALQRGRSLMVMPEGKLFYNPDNPRELAPIKAGMARMARAADVPMVPVTVDGTEVVWPLGKFPRMNPFNRRTVVVTVGEPSAIEGDDDQIEAERIMSEVSATLTP